MRPRKWITIHGPPCATPNPHPTNRALQKRGRKLASPVSPKPNQGSRRWRAGELENQAAFRARATLAVTHRPPAGQAECEAPLDAVPVVEA